MSDARSLTWVILANDLRVWWRGGPAEKRWMTSVLGRLLMLAFLHLVAFGVMAPSRIAGGDGAALVVAFTAFGVMIAALNRSLEVLYNRGDLTLLLASPVPGRVVLRTRLLDITVTTLLGTFTLVCPLIDVGVLAFGVHWLWGWPLWVAVTLLLAPLTVLMTLAMVRWLGARRARTAVQVLAIGLGLVAMVATQMPFWGRMSRRGTDPDQAPVTEVTDGASTGWLDDLAPLAWLTDAARGQAEGSWLLLVGAAVSWCAAELWLRRRFVQGAQEATGEGAVRRGRAMGFPADAFALPPRRALVRTELRLLRRNPVLLVQCGVQIASLIPVLIGLIVADPAGIGGIGLLAPILVTVAMAVLLTASDEMHEYAHTSPIRLLERVRARATAVAIPFIAFAWITAAAMVWLASPLIAVMVGLGGTLNALAGAWLGACTTRTHDPEERARGRHAPHVWQTLAAMFAGGMGAGGVTMVNKGLPAGSILFAVGAGIASLFFLARPKAPAR